MKTPIELKPMSEKEFKDNEAQINATRTQSDKEAICDSLGHVWTVVVMADVCLRCKRIDSPY